MSLSADARHRSRTTPASVPRVLRGAAAGLLKSADTVVAQSDPVLQSVGIAAERVETPEEVIARERAAAYAEGLAAGLADARAEADRLRAELLAEAVRSLKDAAVAASDVRRSLAQEVVDDAVELTYHLARTILGDETVLACLPPVDAVMRAIKLAPEGEDLLVRIPSSAVLNPEDFSGLCDPARITIREDPTIEAGGCVIEVGACRIDGQISSALDRVRKVLAEARSDRGQVEP